MDQPFPVIDPIATGKNILHLRQERGLSVRDVQRWFNFEEPRCIYKWQSVQSLPSVDNLCALSALLGVSMDTIIVCRASEKTDKKPLAMPAVLCWGDMGLLHLIPMTGRN